jgi:hypothetical protein
MRYMALQTGTAALTTTGCRRAIPASFDGIGSARRSTTALVFILSDNLLGFVTVHWLKVGYGWIIQKTTAAGRPRGCHDIATWRVVLSDRIGNRGIDMSKTHLRIIHCSSNPRPKTISKLHGRSFTPRVINGHDRPATNLCECSWTLTLRLVELGLLISDGNYRWFLLAGQAFTPDPASISRRIGPG